MAFSYKTNESNSTAFVCIDITPKIEDHSIRSIIKNLSDYTLHNLIDHGYDVYITRNNIDSVLRDISNTYKHAVVYTNDTEFEGGSFFVNLENLLRKDFFIAGHILDRDEAYYELHDQCFVVNFENYKKLGSIDIGEWSLNTAHTQIQPHRSNENHHHDHTPISISPGDTSREYLHQCFGHNWISRGLAWDMKFEIFDDSIRNCKRNYYAKYADEFHKNFSHYYKKNNYAMTRLFYPANTETVIEPQVKELKQIIIPASGLNFLLYLEKCGFEENAEVVFYDYNLHSLNMMKRIIEEFDGNDYYDFVSQNCTGFISSQEEIQSHWNSVKHLWRLSKKITYRYEHIDIMYDLPKNIKNSNTILHLSNVFAYEPTAAFRSLSHRIMRRNQIFKELQKTHNDVNIIVSAYPEQAFTKSHAQSMIVKDLKQIELHTIDVAVWNSEDEIYQRPIRNTPA